MNALMYERDTTDYMEEMRPLIAQKYMQPTKSDIHACRARDSWKYLFRACRRSRRDPFGCVCYEFGPKDKPEDDLFRPRLHDIRV